MSQEQIDEYLTIAQEWLLVYGVRLLLAIAVFIVGRWIAKIVRGIVRKSMTRTHADEALVGFVTQIVYALLLALVIVTALGQLGVQTTSFVAIIGAAGLAVGLALQGSLGNFASGVLIILFKPFKVGDFVEAAGTMGIVEEISIFTTHLRTPDNKAVIAPNGQITSGVITNFTAKDTRRMDLVFGVAYGDDVHRVKEVILDEIAKDARILKEPAPTVGVLQLGDSSVNFAVRPWVKTSEYWDIFFDLNANLKVRLEAEGFTIPFPQRDVHLFPADGVKGDAQAS